MNTTFTVRCDAALGAQTPPLGGSRMAALQLKQDDVLHTFELQIHRPGYAWELVTVEAPSIGMAICQQDTGDIDAVDALHVATCWCMEPDACAEHLAGCGSQAHGGGR